MIFAKFDEVQNSGGMILSFCKGKNNCYSSFQTFIRLFNKVLGTKDTFPR